MNFLDKYFPLAPHPCQVLEERRRLRESQSPRYPRSNIVALVSMKSGGNVCLSKGNFVTSEDMQKARELLYNIDY